MCEQFSILILLISFLNSKVLNLQRTLMVMVYIHMKADVIILMEVRSCCCTLNLFYFVGSKTHHTFFSVLYPDIPDNCPSVAELQAGNCPCAEDQYVSSNACISCPAGTTNAAGDDPLGDDTSCDTSSPPSKSRSQSPSQSPSKAPSLSPSTNPSKAPSGSPSKVVSVALSIL